MSNYYLLIITIVLSGCKNLNFEIKNKMTEPDHIHTVSENSLSEINVNKITNIDSDFSFINDSSLSYNSDSFPINKPVKVLKIPLNLPNFLYITDPNTQSHILSIKTKFEPSRRCQACERYFSDSTLKFNSTQNTRFIDTSFVHFTAYYDDKPGCKYSSFGLTKDSIFSGLLVLSASEYTKYKQIVNKSSRERFGISICPLNSLSLMLSEFSETPTIAIPFSALCDYIDPDSGLKKECNNCY